MPTTEFLTGAAAGLAVAGSAALLGWRLRVALLPAWSGAPAVLAAAVAAIGAVSLT